MSPERREIVVSNRTIDSDNLLHYLYGNPYLTWTGMKFSSILNLSFATPAFELLYQETRDVHIVSEEERKTLDERINSVAKASETLSTKGKASIEALNNNFKNLAEAKAAGERALAIYFDRNSEEIRVTEPIHGEYARTKTGTAQVYGQGNIPLLEVHTHPFNSLPSPADYSLLFMKTYKDSDIRTLYGFVVLCPDVQILVLATSETPLVQPKEAKKLTKGQFTLTPKERAQAKRLNKTILDAMQAGNDQMLVALKRAFDDIRELDMQYVKGMISEEVANALVEEKKQACLLKLDLLGEKNIKTQTEAIYNFRTFDKSLTNSRLLQFARKVKVKLYASTDLRNFKEFTA